MNLGLNGHGVLVTGSSSGIGRAAAIADADSIRATIEQIGGRWGQLHVLINNAAPMEVSGPTGQPFEEVPFSTWVFVGSRANRQMTGEIVRVTGGR